MIDNGYRYNSNGHHSSGSLFSTDENEEHSPVLTDPLPAAEPHRRRRRGRGRGRGRTRGIPYPSPAGDAYETTLAETEEKWQTAVDKAISIRDDQLATAKQVIMTLRSQLQQTETQLAAKEQEVDNLNRTLLETRMDLDTAREDMAALLISTQKQLEDQRLEHQRELEAKNQEINDLRNRHKLSIQELTKGARETLQELEAQLDAAKLLEAEAQERLAEAQEEAQEQARRLHEWDRVSEKMCHELDDVKGKLKSSKFANGKLREEMGLWKKYAEKVEEERKTLKREVELEHKVLSKFSQVDSFLRAERQQRNILLTSMNTFGVNLMKDLKRIQSTTQNKVVVMFAETQTEALDDLEEKNDIIDILEKKSMLLEETLREKEMEMENLSAQNATLREVILKMKKERENWEREKDQFDEESHIAKLEESVRLIKNNFINDQKDVCVWNALQGVRNEVRDLKNRNFHNTPVNARPTVIAKPNLKTTGVPIIKTYLNRGRVPLKI